MKKILFSLIAVAAVLVGSGASAHAYLQAHSLPPLAIISQDVRGTVEFQTAGQGSWKPLVGSQILQAGDHIRTKSDGSVSIIFYGRSVARLDQDTEIEISADTGVDAKNEDEQTVRLETLRGRVWSRVLKFLDVASTYEVSHSNVVATVRGTAFNFSVGDENDVTLSVTSHQVEIRRNTQQATVSEQHSLFLDPSVDGAADLRTLVTSTPQTVLTDDWFGQNNDADVQFDREASAAWDQRQTREEQLRTETNLTFMALGEFVDRLIVREPPDDALVDQRFINTEEPPPENRIMEGAHEPIGETEPPVSEEPLVNPEPAPEIMPTPIQELAPLLQKPLNNSIDSPIILDQKPPAVTITQLIVSNVSTNEVGDVQFAATAVYSDGSKKNVSTQATWKVLTPGGGNISATGFLTLSAQPPETVTVSATFEGITDEASVAVLSEMPIPIQ